MLTIKCICIYCMNGLSNGKLKYPSMLGTRYFAPLYYFLSGGMEGISQARLTFWIWRKDVAQTVKNPPPMWETWVRDLGTIPGLGKIPWRRAWQPTPDSCLKNPHEQRSLTGYNPWGCRVGYNWGTKHKIHMLSKISKFKNRFIFLENTLWAKWNTL